MDNKKEIDNFDIFRNHLDFSCKTDRYVVCVLRRIKDIPKDELNRLGSNEHQRMIWTRYIDSLDYWDRKVEAIKELARNNNARAYIYPQVRDNEQCLFGLAAKVIETIQKKNYSVKPEHLLRSAYSENHMSRDKKWVLDLDHKEMYGYRLGFVEDLVTRKLKEAGKTGTEWYKVPTPNGYHIITSPFNLMEAQRECAMFYEGERDFPEQVPCGPGEYDTVHHKRIGWLHKDGMSLLYFPGSRQNG